MTYFLNLFSPETFEAFSQSNRDTSGFRLRQRRAADRIRLDDFLVCYVIRLSRWCGLLRVASEPFVSDDPIFVRENDPFVVRFKVEPVVWLGLETAIPIHEKAIWDHLTFTQGLKEGSLSWSGKVRTSLNRLDDRDGVLLTDALRRQASEQRAFPLSEQDQRKLASHVVTRPDKTVAVTIPDDTVTVPYDEAAQVNETRESTQIQALIAEIGAQMGMSIWLPRGDRKAVLSEWDDTDGRLIDRLPLNYDETTLRTIEQIDILWLRRRSIVRAFEVEHTTSVYSGILRMADLLSLQPNMDIKLHIVAPDAKRDKVFQEIRRPVFSLLDRGPLAESCTYLSYESIRQLASERHLAHLSDTVLDEYAEEAE